MSYYGMLCCSVLFGGTLLYGEQYTGGLSEIVCELWHSACFFTPAAMFHPCGNVRGVQGMAAHPQTRQPRNQ